MRHRSFGRKPDNPLPPRKDFWDKVQAAGGLAAGLLGVVIALVGILATNVYNDRQLEQLRIQRESEDRAREQGDRLARIELIGEMIPHLANEGTREAALLAINEIAAPELTAKLAATYRGAGSVKALERIATGTRNRSAEAAINGLTRIAVSGDVADSKAADAALSRLPVFPSLTLTASPLTVAPGERTTLSWSSLGAEACTATGAWAGRKPAVGTEQSPRLGAASTFILECRAPGGSNSRSVTVSVGSLAPPPPPAPTVSLSANPTSVAPQGTSTLTWSGTNGISCTASGGWSGTKATSGTEAVGPLSNTGTYTLQCTGTGGNASQSVTVTVTAGGGGGTPEDSGGGSVGFLSLLALFAARRLRS